MQSAAPPLVITYCHCADCRRWTGAPVGLFVAVPGASLTITPDPGPVSAVPGVDRWFCRSCGSPLAARFEYLPDQIYLPVGILDQAADLAPGLHCHDDSRLPWLELADHLPRHASSGRKALNEA